MTTIHVQYIGEKVLVPQSELERLLELAQHIVLVRSGVL